MGVDRQLGADVAHRPDVADDARHARRTVDRRAVEQVLGLLVIGVRHDVHAPLEQRDVESGVELVGLLPRQVAVAEGRNGDAAARCRSCSRPT